MFSLLLSSFLFKGLTDTILGGAPFPGQSYLTESFVAPKLKVLRNDHTEPGYLFYGITGKARASSADQAPVIMDNSGEVVWYGPRVVTHNFRVQTFEDKPVLTYWDGYGDKFGHGYGQITVMDNTYRKLHEVCLTGNFVTPHPNAYPGTTKNPCYFDGHESYITDRGTILGTAYNVTRADLSKFKGPEDGWVFDSLFYEIDIKTGKQLFRWSALENVPLETSNYFGDNLVEPFNIGNQQYGDTQENPWDFFHINSVQPVPGGYLVNSRMTWSFYFINSTDGSVNWTLEGSSGGDFSLGKDIFFSWQHMPRLVSSNGDRQVISVFNNDNINMLIHGVNQSTGYLLELDMKEKTANKIMNFRDNEDIVYATAEGSYQALGNNHALLGFGTMAVIKEFDGKGNVVYNAQFAPLSFEDPDQDQGRDVHSYRSYRYEWNAEPHYPPKGAAFSSTPDGSMYVYMSWNGATSYDSWNIYAGDSEDDMQKVATGIKKNGFETMHALRGSSGKHKLFQVEALGAGKSLRNSTVIKPQSDL